MTQMCGKNASVPRCTPDAQYSPAAEAVYAEWCELNVTSITENDHIFTRDRRRVLSKSYDELTRQSIAERASRDAVYLEACKNAESLRDAMEGRR